MPPVITTSYCTIATAGHVDHGKTSLIKALTGINPDRLKEEQEREMTTDLGFAHLDFDPRENNNKFVLGFIDVPGHGKFLKNMLAGVGGIASALLVVAADEGPMPQTLQHVKILSLLGVQHCIVALTKIDIASEQEIAQAESKVKALLAQYDIELLALQPVSTVSSVGIEELKNVLFTHLSGMAQDEVEYIPAAAEHLNVVDGEGISASAGAATQPTVEPGASTATHSAETKKPSLYLPVDRAFTKSGYGLVVTGTLVEGQIAVGDQIAVEPGGVKARVRGMESFGKQVDKATAGQRLAVNLAVKDGGAVARGQCLAGDDRVVVQNLIVAITDHGGLDFDEHKVAISPQPIKLYHGTAEAKGTLRWLEKTKTDDGKMFGHIHLSEPIVARPTNRYIVRYGDDGIAGGAILMIDRPRWLTRQTLHDVSALLIEGSADAQQKAFTLVVAAHPLKAVNLSQLHWFLPFVQLQAAAESALASGAVVSIADLYMAVSTREQIGEKILALLKTLMTNEDNGRFGVSIETMRKKTFNTLTRPVMQAIINDLADKKLLYRQGDRIFTRDDEAEKAALKEANEAAAAANDPAFVAANRLRDSVMSILNQHPCLEIDDLAKQVNIDGKRMRLVLGEMVKNKQVQIVDHDFVATEGKLRAAHLLLSKLWLSKKEISPSDFREGLSTTRKYAMALLSYFDENNVTRRMAGSRVLLKQVE